MNGPSHVQAKQQQSGILVRALSLEISMKQHGTCVFVQDSAHTCMTHFELIFSLLMAQHTTVSSCIVNPRTVPLDCRTIKQCIEKLYNFLMPSASAILIYPVCVLCLESSLVTLSKSRFDNVK